MWLWGASPKRPVAIVRLPAPHSFAAASAAMYASRVFFCMSLSMFMNPLVRLRREALAQTESLHEVGFHRHDFLGRAPAQPLHQQRGEA